MSRPKIGVLALQGDTREHLAALREAGAEAMPVRRRSEIEAVDGLVLPGGESTTISHLLLDLDLLDPLRARLADGLPAYGACAGMILGANLPTALGVVLALLLVNTGTGSAKPPLWAMPSMFLSGSAAAAGLAAINAIGGLGSSVGPLAIGWFKSHTGSYQGGLYVLATLLMISAVGTLLIKQSRPREVSTAQV